MKTTNFLKSKIFLLIILTLITLELSLKPTKTREENLKKLRKVVKVLSFLKNSHKILEKVKEKPMSITKKMWGFVNPLSWKIFKPEDPVIKQQHEENVKRRSTFTIVTKQLFYEDIIKSHPDLTIYQQLRISYFIGKQRPNFFAHYKNTAIKKAIEGFIKSSSPKSDDDDVPSYYSAYVKKVLYMNENKTFGLLQQMEKIFLSTFVSYTEELNENFNKNDSKDFKIEHTDWDMNKDILISNEKKNMKFMKKFKFLQKNTKNVKRVKNSKNSKNFSKNQKNSKIQNKSKKSMTTQEIKEAQVVVDSIKKTVDAANKKAKDTLKYYEKISNQIKSNEILKGLRSSLEEIEKSKVIEGAKKFTGRVDILSGIVKIEQGKAKPEDVIKLFSKILNEFGIKRYADPLSIAQNLAEIDTHLEELKKSKDSAKALSEILLIAGNLGSISPVPLHKTLGEVCTFAAGEIENSQAIQKIINEHVENSVKVLGKNMEEGKLPYYSQFFSDFAIDDFVLERISGDTDMSDVYREKYDKFHKSYEETKKVIENINNEVETAHENFYIDRYSAIGNDFAVGDMDFYGKEIVFDGISKIIENFVSNSNDSNYDSDYDRNYFDDDNGFGGNLSREAERESSSTITKKSSSDSKSDAGFSKEDVADVINDYDPLSDWGNQFENRKKRKMMKRKY
jgi:hypothetical protein